MRINKKNMKTGDILLVDTEGFIPSKIDKFQGNDYNHAGLVVCIFGKTYIFEAINVGMAFTDLEDYIKRAKTEDVNLLILRPKDGFNVTQCDIMNFILPLTQKPYGYVNLLFYQLVKYLSKGKIWLGRRKLKSDKSFICGKLVAYIYNHFTGQFKEWHKVAPVDLFDSHDFKHIPLKD